MDHECRIKRNEPLKSGYWRIVFEAPEIAAAARGGQFVHVKITPMKDRILRRPFSISNADPVTGELTVVYKAQRARLWSKSNMPPHVLVMTATPIPRT